MRVRLLLLIAVLCAGLMSASSAPCCPTDAPCCEGEAPACPTTPGSECSPATPALGLGVPARAHEPAPFSPVRPAMAPAVTTARMLAVGVPPPEPAGLPIFLLTHSLRN